MDPIFLNLGIQQSQNSLGSSLSLGNGSNPSLNQMNGIPQESKLATYISNRQQMPIHSGASSSQPNDLLHQVHGSSQANSSFSINASSLQAANLTKSLTALGIESMSSRKPNISVLGDFVPQRIDGVGHNAVVPSSSFQPFAATSHSTTSPSSPIRVHSPPPQSSPIRGVSAPPSSHKANGGDSQALSTFHENVRGTTYFYTAQDMSYNNSSQSQNNPLLYLPYHVAPPTPPHILHMKTPTNAPHLFMGDDLRNEILDKQILSMAHPDPEQFPDLPREVDMYHQLMPLEPPNSIHKSSMFGFATTVYKATNIKTGINYCLYRVHGFRLTNTKVTHIVDMWKTLQHSSIIQLREVFTTKEFGDNSIVFVYDFYPGVGTLVMKHFSPLGVTSNGWERLSAGLNAAEINHTGASFSGSSNGLDSRNGATGRGMLAENTLWTYIIQLTGAVRAIHTQGLACRTLDASKVLLIDYKSRIRINACGILDVLNFDPNAANPLAGVHTYQQEDLVSLGKLIVSLACGSSLALQRDNISTAIDLINRHYSRDLATLVVCLLTSQRVKSINDVMPIIGARFYAALEAANQCSDIYETELGKELHNGRLFRLLSKLNAIVDRPSLNQDTCWSETGDRFMLKLFRSYVFHQQTEEGKPWLDLGHITNVLNKLDSGSPDKVCLMSHNEQNVLIASYSELKKCFERSFQEMIEASSSEKSGGLT